MRAKTTPKKSQTSNQSTVGMKKHKTLKETCFRTVTCDIRGLAILCPSLSTKVLS